MLMTSSLIHYEYNLEFLKFLFLWVCGFLGTLSFQSVIFVRLSSFLPFKYGQLGIEKRFLVKVPVRQTNQSPEKSQQLRN